MNTYARTNRTGLNARFHQLLSRAGCTSDDKALIVHQVSNGQFTSARYLNENQLREAIFLLEKDRKKSIKKMRAKAINKAKELNLLPKEISTPEDWKGLNNFCQKTFKKPFPFLDFDELRHCITALENWQNYKIDKSIKSLLK